MTDSFASIYPCESPANRNALAAMRPLRDQADRYELRILVAPDDVNLQVGPLAAFEQKLICKPGSYLWGIAASTSQPASGFLLQISDYGTRTHLYKSEIRSLNASSVTTKDALGQSVTFSQPIHFLAAPRLILPPGQLGVKLTNLSSSAAIIQVALYLAVPL